MLGENAALTPKPKGSYLKPDSSENIQLVPIKRTNLSLSVRQLESVEVPKDQDSLSKNEYNSDVKVKHGRSNIYYWIFFWNTH